MELSVQLVSKEQVVIELWGCLDWGYQTRLIEMVTSFHRVWVRFLASREWESENF